MSPQHFFPPWSFQPWSLFVLQTGAKPDNSLLSKSAVALHWCAGECAALSGSHSSPCIERPVSPLVFIANF